MIFFSLHAQTLGNHEFDDGIDGLVPFLKSINIPIVVANLNDTSEPKLRGLYRKSIVISRGGRKIGIIGVLTSNTMVYLLYIFQTKTGF